MTKPNDGLLAWETFTILEFTGNRAPKLAVRGTTADDGAVTVPPYPPAKCTFNRDRVSQSMTAHLLVEATTGKPPPAKKAKNMVWVNVFLRNHCVQEDIDTSDWKGPLSSGNRTGSRS